MSFILSIPESYDTEPDRQGVFSRVEFYRDAQGQLIRRTTPYKKRHIYTRVSKASKIRRTLPKFGEASRADNHLMTTRGDEIQIDYITLAKEKEKTPEEESQKKAEQEEANRLPTLEELLREKDKEVGLDEGPKKYKPKGWNTTSDAKEPHPPDTAKPGVFRPRQRGIQYVEAPVKLFVSNIASYQEEDELYALFSKAGRVRNVFIPKSYDDPDKNKGFAFVSFHDHETAKWALENLNHTPLNGMILDARFAEDKPR